MSRRLFIDTDKCVGHGRCYELAPSLITDDETGYGQVLDVEIDASNEDLASSAIRVCPERAISIVD
jgi:ferredoxin